MYFFYDYGRRWEDKYEIKFTYNEDGQCVKIDWTSNDGESCVFDYVPGTINGETYHVVMTKENGYKYYFRLNDNNFVEHCYEVDEDEDDYTIIIWDFEYNSDCQLNRLSWYNISHPDDPAVSVATHVDGDLTNISQSAGEWEISYTSSDITKPIENTDKIYYFQDELDLDGLEVACYAGLFGKPSKHLPVAMTEKTSYKHNYVWDFSADGKQTTVTDYKEYSEEYDKGIYVWSESSAGISSVSSDIMQDGKIYNINGVRLGQPQRGINIVDGKKVLVK